MINNIKYDFIGFEPQYETRNFISKIVDRLHQLAPSDSYVKLAMKKSKNAIEASCRIASKTGVFVADTMANCPLTAIQKIEKKIICQLDEWKKHRFDGEKKESNWLSQPQLEVAN